VLLEGSQYRFDVGGESEFQRRGSQSASARATYTCQGTKALSLWFGRKDQRRNPRRVQQTSVAEPGFGQPVTDFFKRERVSSTRKQQHIDGEDQRVRRSGTRFIHEPLRDRNCPTRSQCGRIPSPTTDGSVLLLQYAKCVQGRLHHAEDRNPRSRRRRAKNEIDLLRRASRQSLW
jgi:hypothetical protein